MANQFLIKETMDAMRNLSASEISELHAGTYEGVELLGYYEKGDTPAPIMYYLGSTTADPGADDGGSVVQAGNIKLQHRFVGDINALYFGCKADFKDAITSYFDNTSCIMNIIRYANSVTSIARSVSYKFQIIFPNTSNPYLGYAVNGRLRFGSGYDITLDAPLIYAGSDHSGGTFLDIGDYSDSERLTTTNRNYKLNVRNKTIIWNEQEFIGIRMNNMIRSTINIVECQGFDVGVQFKGHNAGFAYSKINLGNLSDNRIHADYTSYSPLGDSSGYITSTVTTIYGRVGNSSFTATKAFNRIGIRIGFQGSQGYAPESLTFDCGIIEGLIHIDTEDQYRGIPVQIKNGSLNVFDNFRHESNFKSSQQPTFLQVINGQSNLAILTIVVPAGTIGESNLQDSTFLEDLSNSKQGNSVVSRRSLAQKESVYRNNIVFDSGLFAQNIVPYDSTGRFQIKNFGRVNSAGATFRDLPPNSLPQYYGIDSDGYLKIPSGGGLFLEVDTEKCKRFAIYPDEKDLNATPSKLFYYAYDDNGNTLPAAENIFGVLTTTDVNTYGVNGATDYSEGGVLKVKSSVRAISVANSVKKLRVIISGLNNTRVKSLKIISLEGAGSTGNISVFADGKLYAVEPPNSGNYKKGDIVYHDNSSSILGWVALVKGSDSSIWKEIPYGKVVSAEGVYLGSADGSRLLGTPIAGTISSTTIQISGHTGYPIASGGAVFTFGGATFSRSMSIFTPNLSSNTTHYVQYYTPTGEGLGWHPVNKQALSSSNSAVTPGPAYNQSEVESILEELRDLKTKLRDANILAI
ncbi:hypothetical protein K7A41_01665 [Sphingobacterium sp. InxBP1]|uniref:hypothetical protein n=1 Tax=Sphingobacterium sp. InxBP1 TaxID=2870328 RepID=UPI00224433CE|nr:hypothetical protein [Sphingobacterium sp. InxBP1]MCW8309923.1 hypothetical protein [Sphingobacterium sp. InxBP1]